MTEGLLHLVDVPGGFIEPHREGMVEIVDRVSLSELPLSVELPHQVAEVVGDLAICGPVRVAKGERSGSPARSISFRTSLGIPLLLSEQFRGLLGPPRFLPSLPDVGHSLELQRCLVL